MWSLITLLGFHWALFSSWTPRWVDEQGGNHKGTNNIQSQWKPLLRSSPYGHVFLWRAEWKPKAENQAC